MSRDTALVAALAIGAAVAMQAPLNSQLGRHVGGLPATTIALGTSFVALLVLTVIAGQAAGFGDVGRPPAHVLLGGGIVGALYVGSIVWTVRALGVTGLSVVTLTGQFAAALAIDHFGWLGVDRSPLTLAKVTGVALVAAGTYLIVAD
ncbi:MAG TPA: DMT family transporter [Solirubrobacter sp.]|nr:DMT family transporter [Solirubrobacter sp.]